MPRELKVFSRHLRQRDDDSASDPYSDELEGSSSPSLLDTGELDQRNDSGEEDEDGSKGDGEDSQRRARGTMSNGHGTKRKREPVPEPELDEEAMLQGLRRQLEMIKKGKRIDDAKPLGISKRAKVDAAAFTTSEPRQQRAVLWAESESSADEDEDEDEDDGVSAPPSGSEDEEPDSGSAAEVSKTTSKQPRRSSKHAPTTLSSTKPVSRKRSVIPTSHLHTAYTPGAKRRAQGDPRFFPTTSSSAAAGSSTTASARARIDASSERARAAKAYSFLHDYRASEMAALKAQIKARETGKNKSKPVATAAAATTEQDLPTLKRTLEALQNRERARADAERERDVLRRHRDAERLKLQSGQKTKAWHLKKAEVRKRARIDRFEGLTARAQDRAIERRRKRVDGREKKAMPRARRTA